MCAVRWKRGEIIGLVFIFSILKPLMLFISDEPYHGANVCVCPKCMLKL